MRAAFALLGLGLSVALVACDGARPVDGGAGDAGEADAGVGPSTVQPAQLTPCREGWTPTTGDDGIARCAPWVGERPVCTGATALFPGQPGCTPLGEACTADRFAATLPATGVLFVDGEAAAGGDGTRAAPFNTIDDAMSAASEGDTVALSKGIFDGRVIVPGGVTVRGACVAETTLTDRGFRASGGTVMVSGFGARLENVRVTGANPGVWIEGPGVGMDLEDVLVEEATLSGISVFDATSQMRNVAVRDMRPFEGFGRGLLAESNGILDVTNGSIERARESGVTVLEGQATLRDVVVLDTIAEGMTGDALSAAFAGIITGEGVVIEGTDVLGAYGFLEGSTIDLTDSILRGGEDDAIQIVDGAIGRFERVLFEENVGGGVLVQRAEVEGTDLVFIGGTRAVTAQGGARVRLERAFATGTEQSAFLVASGDEPSVGDFLDITTRDTEDTGVQFQEGGRGTLMRASITRARGAAVVIRGEGTEVAVRDVTALEGRASETLAGRGMEVRVGASVDLDGFTVRDCEQLGLFIEDASGTFRNVTVSDTRAPPGDTAGRGIEIQTSEVTVIGARLSNNVGAAMVVGERGVVTIEDLEVRGTNASENQLGGSGLAVNAGSVVTLRGVLLENNTEVSLVAFGEGTRIEGEGVRALSTRERPCIDTFCADFPGGIGVGSYEGASIALSNFVSEGHPLAGAQVGPGSNLLLEEGRIANNTIGVNVEVDGFDFARIMNQVEYINNERNVDAVSLPVPDALDPLESP
ncbi:MAG: right-handed parallel beta-helix repeat-containing protein [Sandaracinaceae bacterium]